MKKSVFIFSVIALISLQSFAQATGDPWIKKVYNVTWGREPTAMEYNIKNYGDGHWNSYNELMNFIYEYQKNINSSSISFKYSQKLNGNQVLVGVFQNGTQVAADLISNDGGSIVAQGGGNILAKSSTLIAPNGGTIVSPNGGTIVSPNGGTIAIISSTKGLGFSNTYTLQEAGTTVLKTSAKGVMVIK